MGTKIIEQGSTAGGIAKVQYLDESGNVLYEVNDSDKIFKMVNGKISGLAGTGNRMVVADSSGNLSAGTTIGVGNISGSMCSWGSTSSAFVFKINTYDATNIVRFYISQQGSNATLEPRIIEIYGFFNSSQRWITVGTTRIIQAGDARLASLVVSTDTSVAGIVTMTLSNAIAFYATAEYSNMIAG